jgi:CRISPR-associated protein Csc3
MMDDYDVNTEETDEVLDYDGVEEALAAQKTTDKVVLLSRMPMFQSLFIEAVEGDAVLEDFAQYVVGELSDKFVLKAAKRSAFFEAQETEDMKGTLPFQGDQNLRAHLINGMLSALNIARRLAQWDAPYFKAWDATSERIFIAGYVLHDFSKIEEVQQSLRDKGFRDGEVPSENQIPVLEDIFREWGANLGLDSFLQPVGGVEHYLHEIIYVACNTQRKKGTARAPFLLPKHLLDSDTRQVVTELSCLADVIAYIAPTPRAVVAHDTIRKLIAQELAFDDEMRRPVARLVYHHVAENRGLLLNFIHQAVIEVLSNEARIPLLYAPSGVVYLERHDAPAMPSVDDLADNIVAHIRKTAGDKLISTGKGAKRGNTFLQVDDSYNDFFSLSEMIVNSMKLISRYIRANKTPDRFKTIVDNQWTGWENVPNNLSTDPQDARADQIAEWAGFIESQFRDRFNKDTTKIVKWLLEELGIADLENEFLMLKHEATRGGLRYWWHWGAAHALARKNPPMDAIAVQEWLSELSQKLIVPQDLPTSAQVNQATWDDLGNYIRQVLTIDGIKSSTGFVTDEFSRYTRSKAKRGAAVCAICGSDYPTRKPTETTVAFQPGVYTQRIRVGANDNKRNLCSICATEQLLRQLFLDNLDTGSSAEAQRIRYLSFYPSYFFSPETLRLVQRVYNRIKPLRLSDTDFWRAMRQQEDLTDAKFWQRLENFLLRPDSEADEAKFKRVLRYNSDAQATFFSAGFRNLDPTEIESWVLPAFLAFVMAICLDVKIVASDSGVPLILESSELSETLWFDGVHAAIQTLIEHGRLRVDNIGMALARLTAACLIHLDTEYAPPKENWQRFTPIANALCESPLYVFSMLKSQERDDRPITQNNIQRYIRYADLFTQVGDKAMSHANELVRLYRGFYRAKNTKNTNSILRPLSVVSDALLIADQTMFTDANSLVEVAYGELQRLMLKISKGRVDGHFPKGVSVPERKQTMRDFSTYFVTQIFVGAFNKDVAALRGKQLNLLKSACEILYRNAQAQEWVERGQDVDGTDDESDGT